MKNVFSCLYVPKKLLVALASIFVAIGIGAAVQAGFGPGRPTYTMAVPADHITFNSITDNPIVGDERAFLTGALPGAASYSDPVNAVKDGDEVTLRLFVHNDAAENLGLIAINTTVKVALPTGSKQSQTITGYVKADNATPGEVFDTLDMTGYNSGYFELAYVPGSAMLTNNVFPGGIALSDSIVAGGTLIGYDQLNGRIPGCAQYAGWVTLRVKVNMPNYSVEKRARIAGEEGTDKWRETVNAQAGDTIEWLIEVKNIGNISLENIIVLDQVPGNMTVVPGSVKLINANHPSTDPYVYPSSAIQADGTQINVDIGDYAPDTNAFVRFDTVVTNASEINCGANHFVNAAYATPQGYGAVVDEAYVDITKDCGQPVYRCDALSVTKVNGRQIKADVATTASNGASLSTITYSFGDGSTNLVTNKKSVTYTYAKDGNFTVKAVPSFTIGSQTFTAPSDNCVKNVSFGTPTEIPNTGAGGLLGLFAGTSIAGALGYRLRTIRRLGR